MSGILTWGVDARLVRSTLAGNKDAFGRLVERHLPTVEAVAFAYTRNRTDAEDVSQETFLSAYQSLDTLRECAKFGSWVATIARNAGLRMASRGSREMPLTDARDREPRTSTPTDGSASIAQSALSFGTRTLRASGAWPVRTPMNPPA